MHSSPEFDSSGFRSEKKFFQAFQLLSMCMCAFIVPVCAHLSLDSWSSCVYTPFSVKSLNRSGFTAFMCYVVRTQLLFTVSKKLWSWCFFGCCCFPALISVMWNRINIPFCGCEFTSPPQVVFTCVLCSSLAQYNQWIETAAEEKHWIAKKTKE